MEDYTLTDLQVETFFFHFSLHHIYFLSFSFLSPFFFLLFFAPMLVLLCLYSMYTYDVDKCVCFSAGYIYLERKRETEWERGKNEERRRIPLSNLSTESLREIIANTVRTVRPVFCVEKGFDHDTHSRFAVCSLWRENRERVSPPSSLSAVIRWPEKLDFWSSFAPFFSRFFS